MISGYHNFVAAAMRAKAKRLPRPSGIVWTMVKTRKKQESGKYISAYECDPATVADEFLLAKASYAAMTGREQKKANDVLCYQIRQSLLSGRDHPEGGEPYAAIELAMRWSEGAARFYRYHAYRQAAHPLSYILYNSTTLDCTRKFRNLAWGSSFALRRLSEQTVP